MIIKNVHCVFHRLSAGRTTSGASQGTSVFIRGGVVMETTTASTRVMKQDAQTFM